MTTPAAEPGPGHVTVAVHGCGVCGSNLPVWQGREWFEYPLTPGAPGHEAWGEVAAVGDGVQDLRPGDPVAVLADDAFRTAVTVPQADAIVLPEALRGATFPGEALSCAWNAADKARFAPGLTVGVVGVGFMGAVIVARAVAAGCRVIAISRRPFSREVALAMGAHEAVAMDDHAQILGRVDLLTGGAGCDVTVEAVGSQWPLDVASQLLREGGRLVIAGFHQDGTRSVDVGLWNWKGFDIVNAHERDREVVRAGVRAAADAVAAGAVDLGPLYTHRFALDRLGAAMDAMESRPDRFLKALVIP